MIERGVGRFAGCRSGREGRRRCAVLDAEQKARRRRCAVSDAGAEGKVRRSAVLDAGQRGDADGVQCWMRGRGDGADGGVSDTGAAGKN